MSRNPRNRRESAAKRSALFALLGLVALAISAPARAAEGVLYGWSLRAGGIVTDYERHLATGGGIGISQLDLDGGGGPQVAGELRLARRFGVELSAARLDLDAHYKITERVPISLDPFVLGERTVYEADGDYTLRPLTLAGLVHLFPDRKVDVYLGPQVARVTFSNDLGLGRREPEMGYGAKGGVEARFGDGPWGAALDVGYLEIEHDSTDHDLFGNLALTTASALVVFHGR